MSKVRLPSFLLNMTRKPWKNPVVGLFQPFYSQYALDIIWGAILGIVILVLCSSDVALETLTLGSDQLDLILWNLPRSRRPKMTLKIVLQTPRL